MAPPDFDEYEAVVFRNEVQRLGWRWIRGQLHDLGNTMVRYKWRRSQNAFVETCATPCRMMPAHAWHACVITTNRDVAFFAAWERRYGQPWPYTAPWCTPTCGSTTTDTASSFRSST